jgi:RNA polymerase sigma-70 factor (ECF subfamily)
MIQTDDDLVRDSLRGVRQSFRELFDRYGQMVFRHSWAMTRNSQDAEDILQEVFLQAFVKLYQYRGPGTFHKWILCISRNQTLNFLKKKGVKTFSYDFQEENDIRAPGSPSETPTPLETTENLSHLLGTLAPGVREILLFRLVENLPYPEIAELTGLREDNIRQIVSRGLTQLKKEQTSDALSKV